MTRKRVIAWQRNARATRGCQVGSGSLICLGIDINSLRHLSSFIQHQSLYPEDAADDEDAADADAAISAVAAALLLFMMLAQQTRYLYPMLG